MLLDDFDRQTAITRRHAQLPVINCQSDRHPRQRIGNRMIEDVVSSERAGNHCRVSRTRVRPRCPAHLRCHRWCPCFGFAVAVAVGFAVAVAVGFLVALAVGFAVGVAAAFTVAVAVGFAVGVAAGFAVTVVVGFAVGVAAGFAVAVVVGFAVGVAAGFAVAVGFAVGVALGLGVDVVPWKVALAWTESALSPPPSGPAV